MSLPQGCLFSRGLVHVFYDLSGFGVPVVLLLRSSGAVTDTTRGPHVAGPLTASSDVEAASLSAG